MNGKMCTIKKTRNIGWSIFNTKSKFMCFEILNRISYHCFTRNYNLVPRLIELNHMMLFFGIYLLIRM